MDITRRNLLLGAAGTAATLLPEQRAQAQNQASTTQAKSDLDELFAAEEAKPFRNHDEATVVQQPSWKALEKALLDPQFMKDVKIVKADDGKEYPEFTKANIDYLKKHIETFMHNGLGVKDPKIKSAISFKGAELDPRSVLRGRTFFIADKPMNDSAQSVAVGIGEAVSGYLKDHLPKAGKDLVDGLHKFARDFVYRNMFRYSSSRDVNNPSGWHVFAQNAVRVEYAPAKNGKPGYLKPRINYNVRFTQDEMGVNPNDLFTFSFGHGHVVFPTTAIIDKSEGASYQRFRSKDPGGEITTATGSKRHLETNMHEVVPANKVDIFQY